MVRELRANYPGIFEKIRLLSSAVEHQAFNLGVVRAALTGVTTQSNKCSVASHKGDLSGALPETATRKIN